VNGQRILVVGGAGFIGGNLVTALLAQEIDGLVIVDNLLSSERVNVPVDQRLTFIEGSIASDRVLQKIRDDFDYIFHLATYHGNQSSIANPLADHENNLFPTLRLYEHVKGFRRLKKLVYAASGCTLAPHTLEKAEATPEEGQVPFELDSPYQISKVVGEFYSLYYHRQHALPSVRARFQNVYGPREILGAGAWRGTSATVWRNVIPTFVYRAIKNLPLRLENSGKGTRDFIYVGDIVRGLLLCAGCGRPGEVYNLASGVEVSIRELADLIKELAGSTSALELSPRRQWDRSGKRFGSTAKAKQELGFSAEVPLREGLRRTIEWTREKLPLIEACIQKHALHLQTA